MVDKRFRLVGAVKHCNLSQALEKVLTEIDEDSQPHQYRLHGAVSLISHLPESDATVTLFGWRLSGNTILSIRGSFDEQVYEGKDEINLELKDYGVRLVEVKN